MSPQVTFSQEGRQAGREASQPCPSGDSSGTRSVGTSEQGAHTAPDALALGKPPGLTRSPGKEPSILRDRASAAQEELKVKHRGVRA